MRIIALVLERPVIEQILGHIGEPTTPPAVWPARPPPQAEMGFDPGAGLAQWSDMDQSASTGEYN